MRNSLLIGGVLVVLLAIGVAIASLWPAAPEAPAQPSAASEEARRAEEITELVRQGKVGHARALADQYYRAYPHSPRIAEIERLTGYHPRPYAP